ncbi:hypothetical protein [Acetilactobacillus jinshanensis]|uniref:Uncharacterized protein n=1 Tax=Acetilactobacillus jinshanensis TaxID=1720083 RepID=A0A4P6ZKZ2_9LACO|nr:hypothetical protein [Acetilactobacillus jinshanensis]QBP18233.1 hypothetical protein ELX58_03585 [Acetilactobacillus jinshanensis]URL61103.1 hypothetical protein HGK75_03660 [uncultured bacterium]
MIRANHYRSRITRVRPIKQVSTNRIHRIQINKNNKSRQNMTQRLRHQVNTGHYNVFKNTSWKSFNVINNSTRINSRLPKLKTFRIFPNSYRGGRHPQSLNVDQNGHYAYIGFDTFKSDGSKILRYNLYRHHFSKMSRTFRGGHAQAVSDDPHGNLWFVDRSSDDELGDHQGPINKGSFVEVSSKSLKPIFRKWFRFGNNYMGDNLAFAGKYGVFNVSRISPRNDVNTHYRLHMLVIYHTNQLTRHGSQWERMLALRNTPGFYGIQAAAYNPRNQRLYVAANLPNVIISMPVVKILNQSMRRHDIRIAKIKLGLGREVEGLAFDRKGYMYLLFGTPGQLLKSRRPITK